MHVDRLDHLVLTVKDIEASCAFYGKVLGLRVTTFGEGRVALAFGNQKINLHQLGQEPPLKAAYPTPGSGDFCFITSVPLEEAMAHVCACGVTIVEGPIQRSGALGPMLSFYFRDPDENVVEVANYLETGR